MSIRTLWRRSERWDGESGEAFRRCLSCGANLTGSRTWEAYRVCHVCGYHYHLSAWEWVAALLDQGTFREHDRGVTSIDPLSFRQRRSYRSRIIAAQRRTGLSEAALTGTGRLHGNEVAVVVLDFGFLGGSIGVVAGERIARTIERAAHRGIPLISVITTSGSRVQEGLLALMQIPRIAAAFAQHRRRHVVHIAIVADPTTGSAYAGYVNQADIIIGEPEAAVGLAPRRDVEAETRGALPRGAHRTEGHLERGLIDAIVPRDRLRDVIGTLVSTIHSEYRGTPRNGGEPDRQPRRAVAWSQVELSRHADRPTARDLIARLSPVFCEIHGDRARGDDPSIVAGFGSLSGEPVAIIGQQRRDPATRQPLYIGPAGFAKATRAMRLAHKFRLPVITLIDTPGAMPEIESEAAGLASSLTESLTTLLRLPVPTVAVITGEGSAEAAMALAIADRVLMLEHAVYEVVSPEDAARMMYQAPGMAGEVAERLRLTSGDCFALGVVDSVIEEPAPGAHTDHDQTALRIERHIRRELTQLARVPDRRRLRNRLERYRATGATRSGILGTLERRIAHLVDRLAGAWNRLRRRSPLIDRWSGAIEDLDIAV
jgi:acetyl-CoA carboxylase carboxyl transferase subunit beta